MLIKGDRIRQTKEISGFNKVGEVFEIVNVGADGIISMMCDFGVGIMSYSEFEKYFEKVENEKWTNWTLVQDVNDTYEYRTNGRKVNVRLNGFVGKSSCNPEDEFNLGFGISICLDRAKIKGLEHNIKHLIQRKYFV